MKDLFSQSKEMKKEYCCSVVQLGEIQPIEGSDFLGLTMVNGLPMIVRKDEVKEGQVMFYAANECQLLGEFCAKNNLYDDPEYNADTTKRGYFNKYGRVRMIKLRGQISMGFLFDLNMMNTWDDRIKEMPEIGTEFDMVGDKLLVQPYVPKFQKKQSVRNNNRRNKKLKRFDRILPGTFSFHYETDQLNKNMDQIHPEDVVTISVKLHGTSAIIGNIEVQEPKFSKGFLGRLYTKYFAYLPQWLQLTNKKYDYIYSSRSVIINSDINPHDVNTGWMGGAVQKEIHRYGELFKSLNILPEGMTIYGEIVGYYSDTMQGIQKMGKTYDYGCRAGENRLMIYRIHTQTKSSSFEWDVAEVRAWTKRMIQEHPELKSVLHPIDIVYHGKMENLYPDVDKSMHWRENVLERMKNDARFGMEQNEPLCKNAVPREGIVIRKDQDPMQEAFKLKCMKFLFKEAQNVDNGEVDAEMEETYGKE